jgi:hypothetical protein
MKEYYENVIKEFEKRGCRLLTSKDEYIQIKSAIKNGSFRLRYIASCQHENTVFYNVFKSRNTGIVCPSCKCKENTKNVQDKLQSGELNKNCKIEQEYYVIQHLKTVLETSFDFIKNFDGCRVDFSVKPKEEKNDKWIGIQLKTSSIFNSTYSFHIKNMYENCLIMLYCMYDHSIWVIPENIVPKQQKLSIGFYKSKYNRYKIDIGNISNKIRELYDITSKYLLEELNKQINIYQQREQEFRYYREKSIDYITFDYDDIEGLVYDFKINDLKIQEKVCKFNERERCYLCHLCKNGKSNNKNSKNIQYDIYDNDFYWINCDDKKKFLVIPEKVLIDRNYVGNISTKLCLKFTINQRKHNWIYPYLFDYETIKEEENKNKLLKLLGF